MEKTKYKLILIPSSDDENEYEGLTFDEAVALSETREDSAQVFSFDTEKERTAFLQGVAAMEGYMGEGLAYTSEEFAKPLSEQLIDAFKAKYPADGEDETESEKVTLDNLDWARLVYDEQGEVVVENEHGTQFPVDDLSEEEMKIFLLNL